MRSEKQERRWTNTLRKYLKIGIFPSISGRIVSSMRFQVEETKFQQSDKVFKEVFKDKKVNKIMIFGSKWGCQEM